MSRRCCNCGCGGFNCNNGWGCNRGCGFNRGCGNFGCNNGCGFNNPLLLLLFLSGGFFF
ncbi:hypothetical protein [Inconstantimicrobium mannanitabidum]|uniref:hypothetical protein n=1 Tax=Inconstantimicrobium mannanitabidum TaxID=1604901 RepID=UPI0021C3C9F8|nr:hypothetical protein [Clostridium sp. TW13]